MTTAVSHYRQSLLSAMEGGKPIDSAAALGWHIGVGV